MGDFKKLARFERSLKSGEPTHKCESCGADICQQECDRCPECKSSMVSDLDLADAATA